MIDLKLFQILAGTAFSVLASILSAQVPTFTPTSDGKSLAWLVEGNPNRSHQLYVASELDHWNLVHAVRGSDRWIWRDDQADDFSRRFYRLHESTPTPITPHLSWRHQLSLPDDSFLSAPLGGKGSEVRWIKFALILDGLPTVYFQDSKSYPFHYPFAQERLAPFIGKSAENFDALSLRRDGQEIILGAVLWEPDKKEYGIQFVGLDPYPRELVKFLYQAVDATIKRPDSASGFYFPTFEQADLAKQEEDYFEKYEIHVSSAERWSAGGACYAEGWALGRLVFVTAKEISKAYLTGELRPDDILLTDGVPSEVPYVAGIISLAPATPNSHVAILAQSYGIPFSYLAEADSIKRAMALAGTKTEVAFVGGFDQFGICIQRLADVSKVSPSFLAELHSLKTLPALSIKPINHHGAFIWSDLSSATPDEIDHIGGKAANFGYLRREIPDNSPAAIALTFDLWEDYLDQSLPDEGTTLRAEISRLLAQHSWPPNIAALDADLKTIRKLFGEKTDFSAAQKSALVTGLTSAGFDPDRKLRFRSSTNVEDSDFFVGAGLYDSYSGCLHDDTDGDESGPSHCHPGQDEERGAFRAIRKVYAGFYNLNAYLERLRHGLHESEVGMAVLVHHSFPDEFEAANGVASGFLNHGFFLTMVTQKGATSVTNPDGGNLPEIVEFDGYQGTTNHLSGTPSLTQRSSLLRLGEDTVMTWRNDYDDFGDLFAKVAQVASTAPERMEFEFKKLTSGDLVVKQVRKIPRNPGTVPDHVALVNEPASWKLFQGEQGGVFGNHRMKSHWIVETESCWLDGDGIESSFLRDVDLEWLPGGVPMTRKGPPSSWPKAEFKLLDREISETWQLPTSSGETNFELRIDLPTISPNSNRFLFFPADLKATWTANHPDSQITMAQGEQGTSMTDYSRLVPGSPADEPRDGSTLIERNYDKSDIYASIKFYWPPVYFELTGGYTAPLEAWEETVITGLTTLPIKLRGYYSQTYRPEHHNFSENFLFEPALEPGISQATLDELAALNIRYLYFYLGGPSIDQIHAIGFDGTVRRLP